MSTLCKLIKLKFISHLHVNSKGIDFEQAEEIIHSDTLYSAIVSAWSKFYGDDEDFRMITSTDIFPPPFILSSAFPFMGDKLFFPIPITGVFTGEISTDKRKKIKKIKYLEKSLFEKVISGDKLLSPIESSTIQDGSILVNNNDCPFNEIYLIFETPRVVIDRHTGRTEIFHFSQISFEKNCGFFFLVKFNNKSLEKKFNAVIRFLGDEGIGADRSSGKGLFVPEISDFTMEIPESANHFLTLSLYHPTRDEVEEKILKDSYYKIQTRRGWISYTGGHALRRKSIRMIAEGSVVKDIKTKNIYGDMPVVLERNPQLGLPFDVIRNGFCFSVPIKCNKLEETQ